MDSEDMTRALIAIGASGAESRHGKYSMLEKNMLLHAELFLNYHLARSGSESVRI